jgi:hypothetical protein
MIHEDPDELGYFTDPLANWAARWEEYMGVRPKLEPWDPAPPSGQSATIPDVDCSVEEQDAIQAAATKQHDGREVAAELSRERAGYAGIFDAYGNIV